MLRDMITALKDLHDANIILMIITVEIFLV
jgi:hypothetical protein